MSKKKLRIPAQSYTLDKGTLDSEFRDVGALDLAPHYLTNSHVNIKRKRKKHTKAKLKIEQMKSIRSAK